MLDNIKVFNFIVIVCIALILKEIKAHSTQKSNANHHHRLKHETNKISKYSLKHHLRLHHKINPVLTRLIDIENENTQIINNNFHHPLKKRHNSEITNELMNDNIMAELEASQRKLNESFEVQVKEVQNNSLCNYTVTPITNSDDFIIPKNLINITCNYSGSKCKADGFYCCLQTYTHIQVTLKSGGTKAMKINTGCVCALQLFNQLKHNTIQPDINA